MQLEDADDGVRGKPHSREGGLPQKLEPGHKNYGHATKVCHRPQEPAHDTNTDANIDRNANKNNTCSLHYDDHT